MQKRIYEETSEHYTCSWCGSACDESQLVPWEDWLPGIRNILEHNKHIFDTPDCLYTHCKVYYSSGCELHTIISQCVFYRYRRAPKYVPLSAKASPPHSLMASDDQCEAITSPPLSFRGLLGDEDEIIKEEERVCDEESQEEWNKRLELIKKDMPWPQHFSDSTELVFGGDSMFVVV